MDKAHDRVIDELLVMRCQEGNRDAFDLLVRRWQRRLWRYARQLTGSGDAAWDVVQETWVAVLKQIRRLNDPAWFAAWIYRIVRHKCADHGRGVARRTRLASSLAERHRPAENPPDRGPADAVAEAMSKLPPDRRELLVLKYGANLNLAEIAVVFGIPVGTVKSRLHNARKELKRILEGDES